MRWRRRSAAHVAGEILLERRGKVTVEHKDGFRDLVTEADRMAEEAVNEVLLKAFPDVRHRRRGNG